MSALEELRENLREAAQRDTAAKRVRRRRQQRATGLIALLLVGGTAAAGAADLISVGEPVDDVKVQVGDEWKPGSKQTTILVKADSGSELPYGVGVYTAKNGKHCLIAGSLRGYTLGIVRGGKFRPYAPDYVGVCNDPGKANSDVLPVGDRMLVYGYVDAKAKRLFVTVDGTTTRVPIQRNGSYLLVYKDVADRSLVRIKME